MPSYRRPIPKKRAASVPGWRPKSREETPKVGQPNVMDNRAKHLIDIAVIWTFVR
jgi:hypothetical protein